MAGRLRMPSRPRDEARMTLIEHLGELRSRIIKVGVAFLAVAVVAWFFRPEIFDFLLAPAPSLFLAGVAFAYFVVLPLGIDFLLGWGGERYQQIIVSDKYLAFVTRFLLAFGIVFEFPAATYVGAKLELVDAPLLKKYRKHAIVINTVLAAALTPGQDPFSMILM